ncbi:ABC transporter ATP-binding protein [Lentzea pudingi]|uniref:ABC transporter ATP-binding protein n=1 Tax=Lentzea pudingi TaxID=1789439 RepID=A0ABQ2ITK8_9PSEU|nr:ABC transporter ATP-binding protein [Lentzea pudingi]GGN30017.1 ABC transporter ATP-binding protein [Lentzea pudingi]
MRTVFEPSCATAVAVRAQELGKRYGNQWALRDCTFELPQGRVAALVGANGAGKTTLMSVLASLLKADEGSAHAVGRVAFVSQEKPVYRNFSAADMLRLGARLNIVWDQTRAVRWLERFEIPLDRACGKLSGGQHAQVAFALAIGSRPSVLILDEPLANLDPLARREVSQELLSEVAETGMTVLLSTHVVAELGGVADYLLLLARGRLLSGGDVDDLLASHVFITGPRSEVLPVASSAVLQARHHDNQSTFLLRLPDRQPRPFVGRPWSQRAVTLEDYVLAQLQSTRKGDDA